MSTIIKEPPLEEHGPHVVPVPTAQVVGREYVVLQLLEPAENQWAELGSFPATTAEQAIRDAAAIQAADPDVNTSGVLTYVAVPSRSFQPVEVTAKVEPKIEFRTKP